MQINSGYLETEYETTDPLINFTATTKEDILKLIKAAPLKCCELDTIPMTILKAYADIFALKISEIVDKSLATGNFTSNTQRGHIMTIIEEAGLELQLKNYRPVSNLLYILKIIEHIVCNQLVEYTEKSSNFKQFQLAYRRGYSTEPALLKVKMDFLNAIDNRIIGH